MYCCQYRKEKYQPKMKMKSRIVCLRIGQELAAFPVQKMYQVECCLSHYFWAPESGACNFADIQFSTWTLCSRLNLAESADWNWYSDRCILTWNQSMYVVRTTERVPAGSCHFPCFTDPSQSVVSFPCVRKWERIKTKYDKNALALGTSTLAVAETLLGLQTEGFSGPPCP